MDVKKVHFLGRKEMAVASWEQYVSPWNEARKRNVSARLLPGTWPHWSDNFHAWCVRVYVGE